MMEKAEGISSLADASTQGRVDDWNGPDDPVSPIAIGPPIHG